MKTPLLAGLALAFAATAANAQDTQTPPADPTTQAPAPAPAPDTTTPPADPVTTPEPAPAPDATAPAPDATTPPADESSDKKKKKDKPE